MIARILVLRPDSSTGFDSDEPRWNRYAVKTTYMPICRNSLSQFSNVASTTWDDVRYCPSVVAAWPWSTWSSL